MSGRAVLIMTCGLLTAAVIHFAYWLNIHAPGATLQAVYQCNPYFEGCVSVSRAVRSGPGLYWFKLVMLPLAICLPMAWLFVRKWMRAVAPSMSRTRLWAFRLGVGGAVALVFYVVFLGTDGEIYKWLRRYGVVFFFGFTALAQLLTARLAWDVFDSLRQAPAALFIIAVGLQWAIGVSSVFKKLVFDDPYLINQLENISEWMMVALMALAFILIGLMVMDQRRQKPESY